MPIRYILKQLLMPPGILLLLMLLGWWLRRRFPRLAGVCFVTGFGGLWLMSLPAVMQWSAGRSAMGDPGAARRRHRDSRRRA